jgi:DNA-binding NtrC family response regulator
VPIRKPTLLCIDDDPQCLTVRRCLFEAFGFKVVTSINPRQGLRLHEYQRFDAAIIDYQMPGMNGAELSLEMKRVRPDVPIMILSGLPQLPAGARASYDIFMSKTDPTFRLVKEVQRLVETSGQKGQGESVPLARRIFAAAGVALGFATEGASGVRQRILPSRKQPESQPHKARVASRSVISSAPHFRAV